MYVTRFSQLTMLAASLLLSLSCIAEDVVKETPSGGINWTKGIVFAHGYGTAKPSLSNAQRRILSRRAAVVDAQRNLLEVTKGVQITSVLKTSQAMAKSREVATRVEGVIKGAQVLKEHYQNDISTVTMAMPISGEFLKIVLPEDQTAAWQPAPGLRQQHLDLFKKVMVVGNRVWESVSLFPTARAAEPMIIESEQEAAAYRRLMEWMASQGETNPAPMLEQAIVNFDTNSHFSGLLVDASTVASFELATVPNIRDEEGNVLYPNDSTSYDDIVNKRGVTYDFDIQDAVRNQRVATTPFIIKAVSTYKALASDLVISNEDAARISQSMSTLVSMNKAGVLIVVAI